MKRDSYIFYRNWWETFRNMPNELRLQIYDSIMQYAFERSIDGIPVVAMGFVNMAKPLIDKDFAKYEAICQRNKANGLRGGRPKTQIKPSDNPENPLGSLGSVTETQNNPEKPYNDKMINDNDIYNKPKGYEKFDFSFLEEPFRVLFNRWLDYKKGRGEKYKTQDSLQTAFRKLKSLSNDNPDEAAEIVEQSIGNNWAGLFALKNQNNGINTGKIQKEGFEWKQ
ncbi:hypothetical protein SAMN04487851_1144 [Prevotella sp. tc2-28]|uniref:DUF6291 domain-containing protein n=1 Tax=Prevotella sp. tc2-28 TaxID=1761888 RepID=UPI000895867A|nr:DUF6291 domain-containing protein [Prevotella sp. tc2-28]SEA78490.1 hypothetical protein SAMN04487851_1144 [Prevotella sp. tc2-28]